MQNKINRVLSLVLVVIMVLSMIPAAFAEEDSGSAAYAAENTTTGEQYADISDAIAEAQAGQTVKALADAQEVAYGNEGVILDLNGHDLTVTAAEGVTVSAIDSATDDYEGPYGTLTTEGKVATTVKTSGDIKSYVTIAENGSYSFHRYYASIAAISLKPAQAALGYRAEFRGDEAVKNAVVSYGYELWVNDNAHKTYTRTDALESGSLTLRLKNILAEGNDALNALGSTATIGGNAYIALDLGGEQVKLQGTEQLTTLRQVVESINANVSAYGEAQLQSVRDMITTYAAWMEGWNTDAIFGKGEGEGDNSGLDVEITVDVNAQDGVLAEDAVLSSDDITVTVPQGTVLEKGTTQLTLTIAQKASSDSGIAEEEGYSLLPLDVHIAGIAANNTTPIIVCLGEVLPKALNIGNYELYHVENGETVEMTRVYSVSELDAHNEFYYDPATGAVTVAMASFSEVALRNTTAQWTGEADHTWYDADATTLYIYNADQLWSFSQIVGGMADGIDQDSFSDKTVVLYADIDLNDLDSEDGRVFYPIGYWNSEGTYEKSNQAITSGFYTFEGTFDGNGHTIANFYHNTWEMKGDHNWYSPEEQNYRDGMGLFGKVYGGTVKNLTVENFSSDGEIATTGTIAAYADCGATFENITIFNCNPRVYNIGNGGIVGCVGWYNNEVTDENPVTFKNITVDNTNKISALWGSWDVACGGLVGQYYPTSGQENETDNAGIKMVNCHVTAQIDVNNDVCANYQYYAYRYAGILIGSVRENVNGDGSTLYPETGRVYPNMDGITAENCTVGFGDWNDYYYCELVANSIASYTHDYQFSRLTQVASVDVENKQVTTLDGETVAIPVSGRANYVVVTGDHATEHAVCYHFVDGNVWNHDDAGKETVNGQEVLIENNQHIYLEFNNLVTGYGWGVTSLGVTDMEGVEILDKDAAEKFTTKVDIDTTHYTGLTINLGDLFKQNGALEVQIKDATVQAFVSPVGKDSTVTATYVADTENWLNSTLTFHGKGAAEIIITDYYFCIATTLAINVENPVVRYWDYNSVSSVDCGDNGVTLPTADAPDGKTFIGWIENDPLAVTPNKPTVLEAGADYIPTEAIVDLFAVYSYAGSSDATYTLVEDASALAVGDVVVIANKDISHALGTTQNSNNRAGVAITDNGNNTITINETTVQLLTLTACETSNTFGLYTGAGYLYAASSGSNHLRTQTTNNENGYWTITITNGTASIIATESSNRNVMQYNPNNGSPIFSCYSSASQTALTLYKQTVSTGDDGTYYESIVLAECPHNSQETIRVDATCQTEGSVTVICNDCREVVSKETISVISHNYVDGTCDMCGDEKVGEWKLVTDASQLKAGDKVIIVSNTQKAVIADIPEDKDYLDKVSATFTTNNAAIDTMTEGALTLILGGETGAWTFADADGNLLGTTAVKKMAWGSGTTTWSISISDNDATIQSTTDSYGRLLYNVTSPRFTTYTSATSSSMLLPQLYKWVVYCTEHTIVTDAAVAATCDQEGKTEGSHCSVCDTVIVAQEIIPATGHINTTIATVQPSCTEAGSTTETCNDCGVTVSTNEIAALGHNYVDGACSVCGAEETMTESMTIAGTTGVLASDSSSISWSSTNFTFTNYKTSSSSAILYTDNTYYRVYANSSVTIAAIDGQSNATKIVFTCTSSSYASALVTSLTNDGYEASASNTVVTVNITEGASSIEFTASKQFRISNIEITFTKA